MPTLLPPDGQRIDDDDDAHLFRPPAPDPRASARWVKGSFFVALGLFLALGALGLPLTTEAAPLGIVSYEFPLDPDGATRMLASLDETGQGVLGLHLLLDMLFLGAYATFFASALKMMAEDANEVLSPGLREWAARLGPFAWVTGMLDALENASIGFTLANDGLVAPTVPAATSTFAALKFALFLALTLVVFVGFRRGALRAPAAGPS